MLWENWIQRPCVFIRYSTQYKGYRCHDLSKIHICITCHAQSCESLFPFEVHPSSISSDKLSLSTYCDDYSDHISQHKLITSNTYQYLALISPCELCTKSLTVINLSTNAPSMILPPSPTHTNRPPPLPRVAPSTFQPSDFNSLKVWHL